MPVEAMQAVKPTRAPFAMQDVPPSQRARASDVPRAAESPSSFARGPVSSITSINPATSAVGLPTLRAPAPAQSSGVDGAIFRRLAQIPTYPQRGVYTHELAINIVYLTGYPLEGAARREDLRRELGYLQERFDACGLKVNVAGLYEMQGPSWVSQWETFWYNSNSLSDHERFYFSHPDRPRGVTVLMVDSVNWTLAGQGTLGASYPRFRIEDGGAYDPSLVRFYRERMLGSVVVGLYRARWTLAHELAHGVLELQHSDDPNDLMFSGVMAGVPVFDDDYRLISSLRPELDGKTCRAAVSASPFVSASGHRESASGETDRMR